MDVLLVEPWFGGSHRQWAEGFAAHSRHDVTLLTLPDEGWKWRMRGAALTLAQQVTEPPDVILASSLLDLASFLGHARHALAGAPALLYMHENQLTYPVPGGTRRDTSLAAVNWNSMTAADLVAFNSSYHREAWFGGLRPFLASFPEPTHTHMIESVEKSSEILAVGIDLEWASASPPSKPSPILVWNQRWEHDKNPDEVASILTELAAALPDLQFAICGESPHGSTPPAFVDLARRLDDRMVAFGYLDRPEYEQLLRQASVVLSAAHHEFFGVAAVEAMAAGAVPVFPNRLSYPELTGHRLPLWDTRSAAVDLVVELFEDPDLLRSRARAAADLANRFSWKRVAPQYDDLLEGLVARGAPAA